MMAHQQLAEAFAAMSLFDEDVGDVGVRRTVRDDPREPRLRASAVIQAKGERVGDATLHDLAGDAGRPVASAEEGVDVGDVEAGRVVADDVGAVAEFEGDFVQRHIASVKCRDHGSLVSALIVLSTRPECRVCVKK
jgi:hypothetical protein